MNSFYDIERRTTGRYCVHAEMQLAREINIEALKCSWIITGGFASNPVSPQ